MKNLIEEIEKEMIEYGYEKEASFNAGLAVAIDILNQYNIITAPKRILLSELIDKLNYSKHIKFEVIKMNTHFIIENTNFYRQYLKLEDNKVSDISEEMQIDEYKWLYTLWVAGTEIIDDLKELE